MARQANPDGLKGARNASKACAPIRDEFLKWLRDGHATKYAPDVYVNCIDGVSSYLISHGVLSKVLWDFGAFESFQFIYEKVLRDATFNEINEKTYEYFVHVGEAFSLFLREKTSADVSPHGNDTSCKGPAPDGAIQGAIITVLQSAQTALTAGEIRDAIVKRYLLSRSSSRSLGAIASQAELLCREPDKSASNVRGRSVRSQVRNNEKVYCFMPPDLGDVKPIRSEAGQTIKGAVIRVLEKEQRPMTVKDIYRQIVEGNLYRFGAQKPESVLEIQIERACIGSTYSKHEAKDCFGSYTDADGIKVYFLLPAEPRVRVPNVEIHAKREAKPKIEPEARPKDEPEAKPKIEPEAKPNVEHEMRISKETSSSKRKNQRSKIWNSSIEQNFGAWMESEGYQSSTIKVYCGAMNRAIRGFPAWVGMAVGESSTSDEAILEFIKLLRQNKRNIVNRRVGTNQLFAVLTALERFAAKGRSTQKGAISSGVGARLSSRHRIVDFTEGKDGIREILSGHFQTLYGYSNSELVWNAAQSVLPMFLNDNAINSADDLWMFVQRAFAGELSFAFPHIWSSSPDYRRNSQGLVVHLARENQGVVTRDEINDFFQRVKLPTLANALVLEHNLLLFYNKATFILNEAINPNGDRCSYVRRALDRLFVTEGMTYIVLQDIKPEWFSRLPDLPNGLPWTPLLLQELLRIKGGLGYNVIFSGLKGQALDTLGAAIVPERSGIRRFADVVHLFCSERYALPKRVDAEELRLVLRNAGMLQGNELMHNMHKALRDHRFGFSNANKTVLILER